MELLNKERFDVLKTIFQRNQIDLPDADIEIYANVFEIISLFVHGKLTNEEIFVVYDLLSDVLANERPDIVVYVPKEDRIRVQVRLMEEIPETKGKLTVDEKLALAFCIYTGTCIQTYDEERNMMCNGIVLFDSFEHINSEFEYEKKEFPSKFQIDKPTVCFDETYGYTEENPINATSINASYSYLNHLRLNGQPIIYKRLGSCSNSKNEITDKYDIYIEKKRMLKKERVKVATLYINPYCCDMPQVAPKGFTLE